MGLKPLNTRFLGRELIVLDSVDSTNQFLKERALLLHDGTAVIAAQQSKGRGRRGSQWVSAKGEALSLSFLLRQVSAEDMPILPLLCGLAGARALSALSGREVRIKWPNDLVIGTKKLVGILCESRLAGQSIFAVCGIGVNLTQTAEYFIQNGLEHATSLLQETGRVFSSSVTARAILNSFEEVFEAYREGGFPALCEEFSARCVTLGHEVRVLTDGGECRAFARGIAPDGGLICQKGEDPAFKVVAGEVSVRGLYGYL